jgi:endoglucanase
MFKQARVWTICRLVLLALTPAFSAFADIQFTGVNLSGAEFGANVLPGTYGTQYTYPNQSEVDYFRSRGMNIIRLPFRWERLQRTNNATLDATELGRLNGFVSAATAKGVFVILDPHNFARYYPDPNNGESSTNGEVGAAMPNTDFANFWSQIGTIYKTNNHVIFGLMNEPNTMPTEQWLAAANAAIAAIRTAGATNLVLVPGNAWTGAWTWSANWYGTPNAQVMTGVVDPAGNYAFEAHQYLDSDGSGSTTNIVSPTVGLERLTNFTGWLKTNHYKGFLGEFAVANSMFGTNSWQIGGAALTNMLGYTRSNSDVWLGWTWWAAGPWWGNYMFTLEPTNLGTASPTDQPAMRVLRQFIPIPPPTLALAQTNGLQFQFAAQPGFVYQPQTSTNLTITNWTDYGAAITGTGQTAAVVISPATNASSFYRVRAELAP